MASWDRLPKEPKAAFGHFTLFRDSGPNRSLTETARITGISYSLIRQESSLWKWTSRCDQWDAHLDATARKAYVTELEKQSRQRAQAHSALLGVALKVLLRQDLPATAKLSEATAAVKVATDGMRVEAGLATAKVEMDVRDVTPEQARDELRSIVRGRVAGLDRERDGRGDSAGSPPSEGADRAGLPGGGAVH